MTERNTTTAEPATITEKELWAIFVSNWVQTTFAMGLTVEVYQPDVRLRDAGAHNGTFEICDAIADELLESDCPSGNLECRIADLRNYTDNLEDVRGTFHRLMTSLEVETDGNEARYRMPTIHRTDEGA